MNALYSISASFSDFLIDDKSSELVVFCGVLLCSMGSALCILDTDITTITVFWGFIFGKFYFWLYIGNTAISVFFNGFYVFRFCIGDNNNTKSGVKNAMLTYI